MQAIVLVGGLGTRLHPLTLTTPKQMLPLVGRPMIEHVVAGLVRHGVDRVVFSLGFRDDVFRSAYPDQRCAGSDLTCVVEPEPLGTGGAVRFAWEAVGQPSETFLVVNGDVITDIDVTSLIRYHRSVEADATIHLTEVDDPSRYGVVVADTDGRVRDFVEKPPREMAPSRWVNAGTYVMEPSVMDLIALQCQVSLEHDTFPALTEAGTLWAMPDDAYWVDAGTIESYLKTQLDLLDGRRTVQYMDLAPYIAPEVAVISGACVESSVVMAGVDIGSMSFVERSVVMVGSFIGVASSVQRSVVMDGASIGIGARVVRSVVMGDAVIGAYSTIEDSVVGPGASVGSGSTLTEGTIIGADATIDVGSTLTAFR